MIGKVNVELDDERTVRVVKYKRSKQCVDFCDVGTAKFTSNPHIVAPTPKDYSIMPNAPKKTFPEPVPPYLRTSGVPAATAPVFDPVSSDAGHFTLTLRGIRKELRKSGPRTESVVQDVETGKSLE